MTIQALFDFVNSVRPGHAFTTAQMLEWVDECESRVQTDIMLIEPADVIEYGPDTALTTELIVPHPWDKIYRYFLYMMIDLANGEIQRYANSYELYNEAYQEYAGWYAAHIAPATGNVEQRGYYISAYAYAVMGGYTGTREDFARALGDIETVTAETQDWAEQAREAATSSQSSADDAAASAEQARQGAAVSGWMHFEIDDNGNLIYTRTNNVTHVDFRINDDGDLEVIYA